MAVAGANTPGKVNVVSKKSPKTPKGPQQSPRGATPKGPQNGAPKQTPNKSPQSANKGPNKQSANKQNNQQKNTPAKWTPRAPAQDGAAAKGKAGGAIKRKLNESNPGQANKKPRGQKERDPEAPARTIFLGNFPLLSTKQQIQEHFAKYGTVEHAFNQVKSGDGSTFTGYVTFTSREEAEKATKANKTVFKGHHLSAQLRSAQGKNRVFVGNISFNATDDDLWKAFESCGAISSVIIGRDQKTGKSKGFAFVLFESADSVNKALKLDVTLHERKLNISLPRSKTESGQEQPAVEDEDDDEAGSEGESDDDLDEEDDDEEDDDDEEEEEEEVTVPAKKGKFANAKNPKQQGKAQKRK